MKCNYKFFSMKLFFVDDDYDASKYSKYSQYEQDDVTEYDAGACRSVFVGNLDVNTSRQQLKEVFGDKYGPILVS